MCPEYCSTPCGSFFPSPAHHPSSLAVTLASCGVPCEIQDSVSLLTFKALHQKAPSYNSVRVLLSQCAPTLERSRTRSARTRSVKYGDRAFSAAAPALWNGLPAHIRCAKTLDNFKKLLKRISSDKTLTSLKIVQCAER